MTLHRTALAELGEVMDAIDPAAIDAACEMIAGAGKTVLYGCGREGLQLRGFAMRLFHLGREVAMVADMTTPPLGPGDLFLTSAGPGELATVQWSKFSPMFALEKPEHELVERTKITVPAGEFDTVVVELKDFFGNAKTVWMVVDKPGVYAKVVEKANTATEDDQTELTYELQEIVTN